MDEGRICGFLWLKHRVCCEDGIPDYDLRVEEYPMRRVYVLVEDPSDAAFLRRILPKELLSNAELVIAGGNFRQFRLWLAQCSFVGSVPLPSSWIPTPYILM